MLNEHQLPNHIALNVIARVLFTSLFLISGVTHFIDIPYYLSLMPEGFPGGVPLILLSGVVELVGALLILFNWRPRLGAWLLFIFLMPVTFVCHGYEMINAQDEAVRLMQQAHFLKGIGLMGAALLLTQVGVTHKGTTD
ncbi:hypothetical protein R50073_18360 [Maricurvus nonylphenolicus]|uniref:DoxX family membrane protein n=1 Tax=Maricurvus nonylphenolicus TaxID=1008307 RepID=UPI0036F26761